MRKGCDEQTFELKRTLSPEYFSITTAGPKLVERVGGLKLTIPRIGLIEASTTMSMGDQREAGFIISRKLKWIAVYTKIF
jgi:hypothetical protein